MRSSLVRMGLAERTRRRAAPGRGSGGWREARGIRLGPTGPCPR